jgi:endonuclease YncB( thermonuclease family)
MEAVAEKTKGQRKGNAEEKRDAKEETVENADMVEERWVLKTEVPDKRTVTDEAVWSRLKASTKLTAPLFSLEGKTMPAKLYQFYDCDSFYMTILLDDKPTSFKCRLLGLDSAEMRSKDPVEKALAVEARDRMRQLADESVCMVKCFAFDKYGRVLVQVTLPDGVDLCTNILQEKLAFPYDGVAKYTQWDELRESRNRYLQNAFC